MKKKVSAYERVRYLLENVPATRQNDQLLVVTYWKVFNEIDISKDAVQAIMDRGALPESITRYKRDVLKAEQELGVNEEATSNGNNEDNEGERLTEAR